MERDLKHGRDRGFPAPPLPEMREYLHHVLKEHATAHGWSHSSFKSARRGLDIAMVIQDTPGAPFLTSSLATLHRLGLNSHLLRQIARSVGFLEDDQPPLIERWFTATTHGLPDKMTQELTLWFKVMRFGHFTPPRSKPRNENTIRAYLHWALPALRAWAQNGHTSLSEIGSEEVRTVLPDFGNQRARMGQGLRNIFRILKSHRAVFVNPLNTIRTGTHAKHQPIPLAPEVIINALESPNPAGAALAALVAFTGLQSGQLRNLEITDIHSGRLHIDNRVIPLSEVVRQRLQAWITHRSDRWPNTANPHLFISKRTALGTEPVGVQWITDLLGRKTSEFRDDRILYELHASNGDLRRICDMFGLSISGAGRFFDTLEHPALTQITRADPTA